MVDAAPAHNLDAALTGATVIVLRRDAVLMVERGRPPACGLWSFPGGRTEPGEDEEATARRELLEEAGLTVGRLTRLGKFRPAPDVSPIEIAVFAARADAGEPRAGDDALQAEFVPFCRVLARRLTPGAPGWIARALAALSEPPVL